MQEPRFETEKEANFYRQARKAALQGKDIRHPTTYLDGPGWKVNPRHVASMLGRQHGEMERRGEDV